MKCYFYDNGHGNGSYIPSSAVGPPSCNLSCDIGKIPDCHGHLKKCELKTKGIANTLTGELMRLELKKERILGKKYE